MKCGGTTFITKLLRVSFCFSSFLSSCSFAVLQFLKKLYSFNLIYFSLDINPGVEKPEEKYVFYFLNIKCSYSLRADELSDGDKPHYEIGLFDKCEGRMLTKYNPEGKLKRLQQQDKGMNA